MFEKLSIGIVEFVLVVMMITAAQKSRHSRRSNHGSLRRIVANNFVNIPMVIAGDNDVRRKLIKRSHSSIDLGEDYDDTIDQNLMTFLSESPFSRLKVMEYMIDEFVSPSSPDNNMVDKLDNAIEAIDLVETDGEPIQVKGYPFLFVGSVGEIVIHYFHWRLPLHISNLISLLCPQGHL